MGIEKTVYKSSKKESSVWGCSNRSIHVAIGVLVVIMALCLTAMATLYFLQTQEHQRQRNRDQELWSITPRPQVATTRYNLNNSNDNNFISDYAFLHLTVELNLIIVSSRPLSHTFFYNFSLYPLIWFHAFH